MPVPLIDIRFLKPVVGGGTGVFSHKVTKGTLPGPDKAKIFFSKEMESATVAQLEILAQEFFRLLIPSQPETRIAQDPLLKTYYILSEEVPGYRNLPTGDQKAFVSGTYPGLGQIMLTAVFVQEIDLKNGNIGLNKHNQVVKIDGDWCFAAIRDSSYATKVKTITPELLSSLPFPIGYYAFNWLDIKKENVSYISSSIVDAQLANAPHFRNEINEAMLKILLLPDRYLRHFVDAYIPVGVSADRFINYLVHRREELKRVAVFNESFQAYLVSSAAKQVTQQHLNHMKNFVANGSNTIISDAEHAGLNSEVDQIYESLCDSTLIAQTPKNLDLIVVDFSKINSKDELLAHQQALFAELETFSRRIIKAHKELKLPPNDDLTRKIAEKKELIQQKVMQLTERFDLLQQLNFDLHLKGFISKRDEMKLKATTDTNYEEASKQAILLCTNLQNAKQKFLHTEEPFKTAKIDLKDECQLAVDLSKEILSDHRDWKGALLKFIIDVISFLTRGFSDSKLGLFAKTNSAKKLDEFGKELDNPQLGA